MVLVTWFPSEAALQSHHECTLLWGGTCPDMTLDVAGPTCYSAHACAAPLRDQTTTTMIWYPTQSHYPDTELTSPRPVLLMPNTKPGSDKYKFDKSLASLDCSSHFVAAHAQCSLCLESEWSEVASRDCVWRVRELFEEYAWRWGWGQREGVAGGGGGAFHAMH